MLVARSKTLWIIALLYGAMMMYAQSVPQPTEYYMLYQFVDELVMDGVVVRQTAVKPYSRGQIAAMLQEAMAKDSLLSPRQKEELAFYAQDFALELDTLPDYTIYGHRNVCQWQTRLSNLSLVEPSLHLKTTDNRFKMMVKPILGMDIDYNRHGMITHRWYGAEIRMDIVKHIAIWGSIRDNSWKGTGKGYLKDKYYSTELDKIYGARLSKPQYLNNLPGAEYKEASYGGDYSDMRGGVSAYAWWGSIGVQRESIRWGDAYHCSNILSGRNPAVPMLTMQLTPCRWFQFDYFHAWLVSNVKDSSYYYLEKATETQLEREYRAAPKYMAANMFTFIPCRYLSFSFGNSIIYGERTVQAAYFIPIAFYKSLDHLLTKGLNSENQNSQVFFSLSVRPVDHLQLYGSFFLDEFKLARLIPKKARNQRNPVSYLVGFNWSGWPVRGLSLKGEFMRSYIACYTHSIEQLAYTSNSYGMGHYMGDNAQSIFLELQYRPVRGLSLQLSYTNDTKYNQYDYIRGNNQTDPRDEYGNYGIGRIIASKPFDEKIFRNDILAFRATYEVFQNVYARVCVQYNNARAYELTSTPNYGEKRNWNLNTFCPTFYQGQNFSLTCGLNFSF